MHLNQTHDEPEAAPRFNLSELLPIAVGFQRLLSIRPMQVCSWTDTRACAK